MTTIAATPPAARRPLPPAPVPANGTPTEAQILTSADRCDQCSARAYVRANFTSSDLLFCGHHFTKAEQQIRAVAKAVLDERSYILPARAVGAGAAFA